MKQDMELEKNTLKGLCPQKLHIGIKPVKAGHGSKSNHLPEIEKDGGD